jgi:hypothetical protein
MLKSLASKVGVWLANEGASNDFQGNFYHVRVKINVRKPLWSVVSLVCAGKRELFLVKHERLLNWCQVCAHLGHEFKDHGDGSHPQQALIYKKLRAECSMRSEIKPTKGWSKRLWTWWLCRPGKFCVTTGT